jgi:2OG-Fe(II) oxygenase superfamily
MTPNVRSELRREPFVHTSAFDVLGPSLADNALRWLEAGAPWRLRIETFYEQWELHLDKNCLPPDLLDLISVSTIDRLSETMLVPLDDCFFEFKEATAHKLAPGQTIRIHNDFIDGEETHRLLIQLNRGWDDQNGGFLMLFGSDKPEDIRRAVRPIHGSALAFEISPRSYHAVSKIQHGERYTLVYSFKSHPKQ